jgi:hypothetical protein
VLNRLVYAILARVVGGNCPVLEVPACTGPARSLVQDHGRVQLQSGSPVVIG